MAPKFDALRSVVPHREAYCLLVRIDRLWVVPGFINPDEAMAIEMVFLDQHVSFVSFFLCLCFWIFFCDVLVLYFICLTLFCPAYNNVYCKLLKRLLLCSLGVFLNMVNALEMQLY
ncbi:hypothetical protein RIF29_34842 [Crotalaria pallida]|uniref:Uncharacterized protein n=1 Tax=Crotalaria pallida TaxID=3830 RepID=A0AAN9EF28_CROPI